MFLDEAVIRLKAGDGGDGCVSFRREKYVPKGGPDGGDGGDGGNIIIESDPHKTTLQDFKFKRHHKADSGQHGKGKNKTGRGGEDLILKVPLGTVIKDEDTGKILADFTKPGLQIVLAKGGRGGRGNNHFKSSTMQTPKFAEKGALGEEKKIRLELKLLADVGLVGFPNAGKSSLLARISAARPQIADYPFTTKTPNLGVVTLDFRTFVVADIPGLIEGAHAGDGLGDKFLRHIERTRVLIHIIDLASMDGRDPIRDYININNEMKLYSPKLMEKPQVVALNKIDLPQAKENLEKTLAHLQKCGHEVFVISAATGEGILPMLKKVAEKL